MNWRDEFLTQAPAGALLVASWVSYYLINRPLRTRDMPWRDNIAIADHSLAIAQGSEHVLRLMDPYLRYAGQALLLKSISPFVTLDWWLSMKLNSHYVIFFEGLLTPLVLYWLVQRIRSRRAGLITLVAVLLFQFPVLPIHPNFTLPAGVQQFLYGTTVRHDTIRLFGRSMYLHPSWQYAYALPFIIGSFGLVATAERPHSRRLILAGICLGIAASIQVVQAGVAALIVGVGLLWTRDFRQLITTAIPSMIVASPNGLIFWRKRDVWLELGLERLRMQTILDILTSPLGAISVLVAAIAVVVGLWQIPPRVQGSRMVAGVRSLIHEDVRLSPLTAWPLCCAGLLLIFIPLDAWWYRLHVEYILKFGLFLWIGVGVDELVDRYGVPEWSNTIVNRWSG